MEKNNEIPASHLGVGREHKIVETYAGDIAEMLENDKEGLVKKIIHGEEKHEEDKKNLSPESKKNKLFFSVGFLLVILSLIILFFFLFKKADNTIVVESQFTPIIFNDKSSSLEVSGMKKEEIAQVVLNEINTTDVKVGGVEAIYLTENKQILGLRRFISLIKSNFVPGDNTFFVNDDFLMGVVNNRASDSASDSISTSKDFFILLKVRSATDIFNALRIWEGKMFLDLHGFFGIDISADTKHLLTKDFKDGIVENKNARILYDKDNKVVLMYVFADDNSIVITSSQKAVHEIMLRLASSQKKQ
jgi:hypothetical protein